MNHFSLFAGIGGIDLAAEWAGFKTVGQCELADYPYKVLCKHWPDVPKWRDIRDVTRESVQKRIGGGRIGLLSAGIPCQPHSLAGKRQASCDERDLWPETARVIREIKPRWFLGENVPGLLSSESGRFFGRILRDLAQMGYSVGWCCYEAAATGANFYGERVFIVAASDSLRWVGMDENKQERLSNFDTQSYFQRKNGKAYILSDIRRLFGSPKRGVLRNDDGLPEALDRLKCLGNAVNPYQVYPILKAIYEIEYQPLRR